MCLIKGLQGTVSGSAWKDKQVECVFVRGTAVRVRARMCVVCCPVGSFKHLLMAQLCLSNCNSQNPLPVSLYADFAMSKGLR